VVILLDDLWRSAGKGPLGEFLRGKELGIAVVAVARAEEVHEAVFGDEDLPGSCQFSDVSCRWGAPGFGGGRFVG